MGELYKNVYNPDVLSCLANLSNDEVFTPPEIANNMLDMLPKDIWSDPNVTFLDPACKSGVFLREIAKRLIEGLKEKIPDLQTRIDHIFHKQLFGIAITELTSLLSRRSVYCSKFANGKYSISRFDLPEGNIRFERIDHTWKDGKCIYCGASEAEYDRDESLETHAYQFIHVKNIEDLFKMKFDVIIGNPPYQLNTGNITAQATPLYDKFIFQAEKLKPRYLSMIIPSRWFAGGMGLDKFRKTMLNDKRIKKLVDYPNAKDCFSDNSIGGGVCYFLWARDYKGLCTFSNIHNGKTTTLKRDLSEFPIFVRYNEAITIIHKIANLKEETLANIISSLSPFGINSSERGSQNKDNEDDLRLFSSKGVGYYPKKNLNQGLEYIGKYKLAMSKVTGEHAGEPDKSGQFKVVSRMMLLGPEDICTFSYFIIGCDDDKTVIENIRTYLSTKFVRFLLLQAVTSINISKEKFQFVPMQDFSKPWTDEELYKKYDLDEKEIEFIESMIKPMDLE